MPHLSPMNWMAMFISSWFLIFVVALNTTLNKNNKLITGFNMKTFKNKAKY